MWLTEPNNKTVFINKRGQWNPYQQHGLALVENPHHG